MTEKKNAISESDDVLHQLSKILVPEKILNDFEVCGTKEYKSYWQIELREKRERVPEVLKDIRDEVVLDGYCNPINVLSHSFSLKQVRLQIYRRRWKERKTDKHYSNEYDFTMQGLRIVPELGIFLKEEDRRISSKYKYGSKDVGFKA